MYTYTVTHDTDDNTYSHVIQANTKIMEAFYGRGDMVEDPNHLKIIKELGMEFNPERGDYLSIYLAELIVMDF